MQLESAVFTALPLDIAAYIEHSHCAAQCTQQLPWLAWQNLHSNPLMLFDIFQHEDVRAAPPICSIGFNRVDAVLLVKSCSFPNF